MYRLLAAFVKLICSQTSTNVSSCLKSTSNSPWSITIQNIITSISFQCNPQPSGERSIRITAWEKHCRAKGFANHTHVLVQRRRTVTRRFWPKKARSSTDFTVAEQRKNPVTIAVTGPAGASDVTRTHDLLITNQLLYRLSYTSEFLTACTFYHKSLRMSTPKFDDY